MGTAVSRDTRLKPRLRSHFGLEWRLQPEHNQLTGSLMALVIPAPAGIHLFTGRDTRLKPRLRSKFGLEPIKKAIRGGR